jgi:hypothetical protein
VNPDGTRFAQMPDGTRWVCDAGAIDRDMAQGLTLSDAVRNSALRQVQTE